jgi:hypothetical protein
LNIARFSVSGASAARYSQVVEVRNGSFMQTIRFGCLMTALFGVTLVAFKFFNFLLGGAFLVLVTMWLLGERRPVFLVSVTLLSPVLIWLFIDVLLGRSLP